jgi:hypothetical protein
VRALLLGSGNATLISRDCVKWSGKLGVVFTATTPRIAATGEMGIL